MRVLRVTSAPVRCLAYAPDGRALATGGQPRTGSYGRGSNIFLDLPFRTQQDNTVYSPTNSGPASMAMVLGGYGTDVAVSDLRALMNGLDGNYSAGATPRRPATTTCSAPAASSHRATAAPTPPVPPVTNAVPDVRHPPPPIGGAGTRRSRSAGR